MEEYSVKICSLTPLDGVYITGPPDVIACVSDAHVPFRRLVQDTLKEALPGLAEHLRAAAADPPVHRSDGKSLLRTRPKERLD